jgi:hypothetical protein
LNNINLNNYDLNEYISLFKRRQFEHLQFE